jgi:hypothetical protein
MTAPTLSPRQAAWLKLVADRTARGEYYSYCGYMPSEAAELARLGLARITRETIGDKRRGVWPVWSVDITPDGIDAVQT